MGYRRRLIGGLLGLAAWSPGGYPQTAPTSVPISAQAPVDLSGIRDFAFDFGQPGFYALLEYVQSPNSPSPAQVESEPLRDWAALVERPGEFRGRVVTVEGVVGRNSAWRVLDAAHVGVGTVWQLELRSGDQAYPCTVILTGDTTDVPLGALLRVSGYFCLVRQFRSDTGQVWQAPLIVGVGPTTVARGAAPRPQRAGGAAQAASWFIGIGSVLAAIFLALRWFLRGRISRHSRDSIQTLVKPAPFSVSDDFSQWAQAAPENETHDH